MKKKDNWIPINSKRQPEINQPVLIARANDWIGLGRRGGILYNGSWFIDFSWGGISCPEEITHWKPLPKIPKRKRISFISNTKTIIMKKINGVINYERNI